MIYMILLLLCSFICVIIGNNVDNKMIDNDRLAHKRKLITELDNRIRRKNVFNTYDEKLIEDIILFDITRSNNDSTINTNSLSYKEKTDMIYNNLDSKWEHKFYRYDNILNKTNIIPGWVGRKMIGSNCIVIERAVVTRYYKCEGCIIENALGCLNDLRQNISGNVPPRCNITFIGHLPDTMCCPLFGLDKAGRMNLIATTAGYPDTLRCIQSVGCGDTDVYNSLLEECQYTCPLKLDATDPSLAKVTASDVSGGDVCFASYNAGSLNSEVSYIMAFVIVLISLFVL